VKLPAWWRIAAVMGLALLMSAARARGVTMVDRTATDETNADPDAQRARANRAAFLAAIRWAEGTDDGNGYRAVYGHTKSRPKLFGSFAAHPVESGEWPGERLTDAMCRGAGLEPGCITTAAGAYQMILPTWRRMAQSLGLRDFTPASQDQAALWLIREAGALTDVDAGRFDAAVGKVRRVWASLPGAGYEQPERSITALRDVYGRSGGAFA
jgi:muramidase (phage lysozyme)